MVNRNAPQVCESCGGDLKRVLDGCQIQVDIAGYTCPISGKWIGSRREHKANLARHGCRVLEPGETEGGKRARARAEVEMDKGVEATVEAFVEGLPATRKEALESDLKSGLTLQFERG